MEATNMARDPSIDSHIYALAAISMLEGVLQMLRRKGIATDAEVRSLFLDRAAAWDGAPASTPGTGIAAVLSSMAGSGPAEGPGQTWPPFASPMPSQAMARPNGISPEGPRAVAASAAEMGQDHPGMVV